jgi:hypothetical protein
VIAVCRTCHRDLSDRQYRWAVNWHDERHPIYCIVQGVADCLAVWYERSPFVEPMRELLTMLFHAALALLACLRADAIREVTLVCDTTIYDE